MSRHSVRSRGRWRMISWPAAKPMRWVKPSIATVSPSCTSAATASRIDATLECSWPAHHDAARSGGLRPRGGDLRHGLAEDPQPGRDLVLGRRSAQATCGRTSSPAFRTSRPRWKAASWTASAVAPESNSTPIMRPLPRTSRTIGSWPPDERRSAASACSPRARGVGHEPALEQLDGGQQRRAGDRIAAVRRAVRAGAPVHQLGARHDRAEMGMPEAMPLAASSMSGSTPQCSMAHMRPVRPAPDWISSATSRMPWASQMRRRRGRKSALGDDVAALALDRLDEDRGHLVGRHEALEDALLELVEAGAAERHVVDARQERPEAGVVLGLRGGQADRAVRPAVERAEERDDVLAAGARTGRA